MIDNVTAGIMTLYNSGSGATLKALLTGGFWSESAPENTAYPYIVFNCISNLNDEEFTKKIEYFRFQFTIWHNNPDASATGGLKAIYEALRTLFDEATLTVSGYSNYLCMWDNTYNLPTIDGVLGRAVDYGMFIEES